ncbi:MAG: carboxypeptidase-like regulatory domain-containing protein, partial [Crocinitomicaceae bacterium]|nr:carboxypeptidase-like regulatory domain-containing protein [Crocinitomicaceae bacterium]
MVGKLKLLLLSVLFAGTYAFSQSGLGTLKGTIKDESTGLPIELSKVLLKQGDQIKSGAQTDAQGKFQINGIPPGTYDLHFSNAISGYSMSVMTGVAISPDRITFLDNLTLAKKVKDEQEVRVVIYKVPLIDKNGGASGATVTREDINRMPVRSAEGVARSVGGVNSNEGSGAISV